MKNRFKQVMVWMLIFSMGLFGATGSVLAAPIGTQTLIQSDARAEVLSRVQSQIARHDVREQLVGLGVSPTDVDARIAALSTDELQLLSAKLDEMPAGGSLLGVIGVVFVVLLVLEVLGVTNVFTRI